LSAWVAVLAHSWPLAAGAILYVFQSLGYFSRLRLGMTIAFFGYTIGNIGLLIDAYEVQQGKE
jgi:hypothetical protein